MTATLTTRLDQQDKKDFESFCKAAGLTPSSAINMFVKATLREGEIPFKIKADPFYSDSNMKRLEKNAKEMQKYGGSIHEAIDDGESLD